MKIDTTEGRMLGELNHVKPMKIHAIFYAFGTSSAEVTA